MYDQNFYYLKSGLSNKFPRILTISIHYCNFYTFVIKHEYLKLYSVYTMTFR